MERLGEGLIIAWWTVPISDSRPLRCCATRVSVASVVKKEPLNRGFVCWMILGANAALLFCG